MQIQHTEISLVRTPNNNQGLQHFSSPKEKFNLQNAYKTRYDFQRVLNLDYCSLILILINIIMSLFYYDSDYSSKPIISKFCLFSMLILVIFQVMIIIFRYIALIELQKAQMELFLSDTIFTSGKLIQLILQIHFILIQPYPFLNKSTIIMHNAYDNFQFAYKINYILVVAGFIKLFIVIRVVLIKQIYMSPRSNRICKMFNCQANYRYAIKCLFKDSPLIMIGVVFLCSIMIFAVSLRIAQRNTIQQYSKFRQASTDSNDISKFQNAVWLTIITMTTVGYGDYYPKTTFGRIIDTVLVVWGIFIVSLMVVVLTNTLNMDQSQKRVLIVLNRLEAKKYLKKSAAILITAFCKKYLLKKKILNGERVALSIQQQTILQNNFYSYLNDFKKINRQIRSMYQIDNVYEQMNRHFEFINDEIDFLLRSQVETLQNVQAYIHNYRHLQQ